MRNDLEGGQNQGFSFEIKDFFFCFEDDYTYNGAVDVGHTFKFLKTC